LDPLDFDIAPDDELPSYDASVSPPLYNDARDEPLVTYSLRQYDRKIQMLVAQGSRTASYRITSNGFRVFGKKPDMEVLHTSRDMRQRTVASICYDNNGGFPWRPRAHFEYTPEEGAACRYDMESRNFRDWSITIGGRTYLWMLHTQPASLVLSERNSGTVVARFIYSAEGATAQRGADVGELVVCRTAVTVGSEGVPMVVCGLMVVLGFLKKNGWNCTNGRERGGSLGNETRVPATHRGSSAGWSSMGDEGTMNYPD
jgi:hypothetical protein